MSSPKVYKLNKGQRVQIGGMPFTLVSDLEVEGHQPPSVITIPGTGNAESDSCSQAEETV